MVEVEGRSIKASAAACQIGYSNAKKIVAKYR